MSIKETNRYLYQLYTNFIKPDAAVTVDAEKGGERGRALTGQFCVIYPISGREGDKPTEGKRQDEMKNRFPKSDKETTGWAVSVDSLQAPE